ncbi:MAG: hypothetical protein OXE77_00345 [Flavobacteriaceae bacterium]|nr:hypothetical protein [Flavobacteriaceae bacterium]
MTLYEYRDDTSLLEQVAQDFKEYKIIMQIDQARWSPSKNLKIPENNALIE